MDLRVRNCAQVLQDTALLAKLSAGDLVAQEEKYQTKCLVALYNKAERIENSQSASESSRHESMCHAIALADIVRYIEDAKYDQTVSPVFQMTELISMYSDRLKQLGIDIPTIHSTRLKDKILTNIPDLQTHKEGRTNVLALNADVAPALKEACDDDDFDSDLNQIHKTAKRIRKDIYNMSTRFTGSFSSDCQEAAVPQSLLTFMAQN